MTSEGVSTRDMSLRADAHVEPTSMAVLCNAVYAMSGETFSRVRAYRASRNVASR